MLTQYADWTVWMLTGAVAVVVVVLLAFNLHHATQWPWLHYGPRTLLPRLVLCGLVGLLGLNLVVLGVNGLGASLGWWRIH